MNNLKDIYNKLYTHFGPRNWWPVTEGGKVYPEYSGGPKNEKQQLEVVFGAILTQNTSWKNAEQAVANLNKKEMIDAKKITEIGSRKLAGIIKPSGYHNLKSKKLKNFCSFLCRNYDGSLKKLFQNDIKKLREELLSVNGIGPETADSIILYAARKPIFVIDAYTKRILGRMGYTEKKYEELQRLFMGSLPNSEKLFNEYHALLVELGKSACRKKPLCEKCSVYSCCSYPKAQISRND